MRRTARFTLIVGVGLFAAACAERVSGSLGTDLLDAAFTSMPVGFDAAASSFSGDVNAGERPLGPGGHGGPRGENGLPGGHDFMGGGFGLDFLGGPIGGRPFEHGGPGGSSSATCAVSTTTGNVTCTDTRDGVTITQTITYKNAAGTAQSAQDVTTNSIVMHVVAAGTRTHRDGALSVVANTSDRTVTGLASTSTQRTVNGKSAGTESTTGTDTAGAYTARRTIGDTTSGVIIPVVSGKPTYPTAGSVIRSMKGTLTYTGKTPTTKTRREVVAYDGTATAKLVITEDGTTRNCTVALPRGRPVCS